MIKSKYTISGWLKEYGDDKFRKLVLRKFRIKLRSLKKQKLI